MKEKDPHIKSLQETSKEYFTYAVGHLKNIIISDPLSLKYTQALAVAYNCIGDKENFNIINNKLASLGGGKIESNFIPQLIEFNGEVKPSIAAVATQQQSIDGDSQAKEDERESLHIRHSPFHSSRTASTSGSKRQLRNPG